MERDLSQKLSEPFQRAAQVVPPEKFGVGQPRADHALIAGDDSLAAVFSLKVRNENEAIGKFSRLAIAQRKALLMHFHGCHQDFFRHFEETLVECA